MNKKAITYAVEIILIVLLTTFFLYTARNASVLEASKLSDNIREIVLIKTLLYSMNFSFLNKLFYINPENAVKYLNIYTGGKITKVYLDIIHPIQLNYEGTCGLFFYPVPEDYITYIDINSNNKSCRVVYWRDWYYIHLNNLASNNITINITKNVSIDINSIYVFSNNIPIDVKYVNITKNEITLFIYNFTLLNNVDIYFRNKTYYPVDLPYRLFDYRIVSKNIIQNPITITADPRSSNWITILEKDCGDIFVIRVSPYLPNYLKIDNNLIDNCTISSENVSYFFSNPKYNYMVKQEVSYYTPKTSTSIPLLFLPMKIIKIYVS